MAQIPRCAATRTTPKEDPTDQVETLTITGPTKDAPTRKTPQNETGTDKETSIGGKNKNLNKA